MQNPYARDPFLALDITFTPAPQIKPTMANSSDHPEKNSPLAKVHDERARQKFNVPHAFALLTHNIILLPMTFNHLGGTGSFTTEFLFGSSQHQMINTSNPAPNWSPQNFQHNPDAYLVCGVAAD
jgi:hypothetical protein